MERIEAAKTILSKIRFSVQLKQVLKASQSNQKFTTQSPNKCESGR